MNGSQEKRSLKSVQSANQFIGTKRKKGTRKRKRKRNCRVNGCLINKIVAKGFCDKHYRQIRRHGKILKRTIYDPNEIIDYGNYIGIVLRNKRCEKVGEALADKQDEDLIKKHKWYMTHGYATVNSPYGIKCTKSMHQLIFPENKETDHRDRKPLNNRRYNLRKCTHQENKMNIGKYTNNTSGTPGVCWDNRAKKWVVSIQKRGYDII